MRMWLQVRAIKKGTAHLANPPIGQQGRTWSAWENAETIGFGPGRSSQQPMQAYSHSELATSAVLHGTASAPWGSSPSRTKRSMPNWSLCPSARSWTARGATSNDSGDGANCRPPPSSQVKDLHPSASTTSLKAHRAPTSPGTHGSNLPPRHTSGLGEPLGASSNGPGGDPLDRPATTRANPQRGRSPTRSACLSLPTSHDPQRTTLTKALSVRETYGHERRGHLPQQGRSDGHPWQHRWSATPTSRTATRPAQGRNQLTLMHNITRAIRPDPKQQNHRRMQRFRAHKLSQECTVQRRMIRQIVTHLWMHKSTVADKNR